MQKLLSFVDITTTKGITVILSLIGITYFLGSLTDIMQVDAAQYAFMSWEMMDSGEYLQVKYRGQDYLDKPPLLFWLGALSFKIFGVSNFSYHLPSVLAIAIGSWSVYRTGRLQFGELAGRMAGLMMACCMGIFIINQDCKTDNLLIGGVAFSIYQLIAYTRTRSLLNAAGIAVGLSWALLAKGPIGLIVPGSAAFGWLLFSKQWRLLFHWHWLITLTIIALALTPMTIGLYKQHGADGPLFYFYKQSFGRITGASEWENQTDPFFFIHTFLWAFAPFVFPFIWVLIKYLKALKAKSLAIFTPDIMFNVLGFLLPFAALSMSRFKLPHYIFVVIPFASLLTGNFLATATTSNKWFKSLTIVIGVIGLIGLSAISFWVFPPAGPFAIFGLALIIVGMILIKGPGPTSISPLIIVLTGLFIGMNTNFYPPLLTYQTQSAAGRYLLDNQIPKDKVYHLGYGGNALYYYSQNPTKPAYHKLDIERALKVHDEIWVYTREDHLANVSELTNVGCDTLIQAEEFRVALLTLPFLNPKTRGNHTKTTYLLRYHLNK